MKMSDITGKAGAVHFSREFLDEIRLRVPLSGTIGRRVKLGRKGRENVGLCPFHKEKTPSFTVNDDKGFFHCFGCGAHGDGIAFGMRLDNLTFSEAVERLAEVAGLSATAEGVAQTNSDRENHPATDQQAADSDNGAERTAQAREIWQRSVLAVASTVQTYLRSRAITLPPPPSLRFHPDLTHKPSGLPFPAMVAAIQGPDRAISAVHRTFLLPDGRGKANVISPKMTLGSKGSGAVRLAKAGPMLGLAEGIETALSAQQLFTLPCWAACGPQLDRIALPDIVRHVVIYADNGDAGHDAAHKAVEVFTSLHRRVTLRLPPEGYGDWNDALQALEREQVA